MRKTEVDKEQLMKYKWEFARENPYYQKDCDKYKKAKNKREAEKLIIKKYGIKPLDYKKNYNEITDALSRMKSKTTFNKRIKRKDKELFSRLAQSFDLESAFFPEREDLLVEEDSYSIKKLNVENLKDMGYKPIPSSNKTELKKIKTLRLSLNLYYSKKKLLSAIGRIIDTYKTYVKTAHGANLDRGELFQVWYEEQCNDFDLSKIFHGKDYFDICRRKRSDLWDSYLKIYDLKVKDDLSFRAIAEKIYPEEFRKEAKKVEPKGKEARKCAEIYAKVFKRTSNEELAHKEAYGDEEKKSSNKVIQRVIDRFNEAKRMVEGGYKEIRAAPYF